MEVQNAIDKMGYKKNSPFKNKEKLLIRSNNISLKDVEFPLLGISNQGETQLMLPGQNYNFKNADYVMEYKLQKQKGGYVNLLQNYLTTLSENQQDELIDTLESISEQERYDALEEYMNGGCYKCGGKIGKTMQSGGQTPIYPEMSHGNVEVEHLESAKLPNGDLVKFEGNTHANGGIQTQLPGGTMIFSEFLKSPKEVTNLVLGKKTNKKYSYADLSKKFPTQKSLNTLKNPDSDSFEINTAEITLNKNQAMLDTIFAAQEMDKAQKQNVKFKPNFKNGGVQKFQKAGLYNDFKSPEEAFHNAPEEITEHYFSPSGTGYFNLSKISDRFRSTEIDNVFNDPVRNNLYLRRQDGTYDYVGKKDQTSLNKPTTKTNNFNNQMFSFPPDSNITQINGQAIDYFNDYPKVHTEPSPTVTTGINLPKRNELPEFTEPQFTVPTDLQLVMPTRNKSGKPLVKNTAKPKPRINPTPDSDKPESVNDYSVPLPFDPLPTANLSNVQLPVPERNPFESVSFNNENSLPVSSDDKNYPGVKRNKFRINPKITGTIMDIGLALSDNLNVEAPVLFNNKTYPIFNRFVQFDNKEPGRNLALAVQQVQNSNMPEQVKQAQIAQLTAQANEQQSQTDFTNQQRYEQKQERDVNKLQQYMDRNTLVGNQDLENYLQRKGRVESLKNQFKAQRKSRIVNSLRGLAEYADDLYYQNQLNSPNYDINFWTGDVDFTGQTSDPLKQQEMLMRQYQTSGQNTINLPNGATMTLLSNGNAVVVDSEGKTQIVKVNN